MLILDSNFSSCDEYGITLRFKGSIQHWIDLTENEKHKEPEDTLIENCLNLTDELLN